MKNTTLLAFLSIPLSMGLLSTYASDTDMTTTMVSTTSLGYSADDGANFLAYKDVIVDSMGNPAMYVLNSTISRQEMLKVVVNISGGITDSDYMGEFKDVKSTDWIAPYIETALKKGIITDNVWFRPGDNVTEAETLKMILKAKGLQKISGYSNWYMGYNARARNLGLIDYDITPNNSAIRGFIFHAAARTYADFSTSIYGQGEVEEGVTVGNVKMVGSKSIYSNLALSSDFSTLILLLDDAGMKQGLMNAGPVTLFAPTNEAFLKLSTQTLANLQKTEMKDTLINFFKDHLVSGYHAINDETVGTTLTTFSGKSLYITKSNGNYLINGKSTIQVENIKSANGFIQIVGTVLTP